MTNDLIAKITACIFVATFSNCTSDLILIDLSKAAILIKIDRLEMIKI